MAFEGGAQANVQLSWLAPRKMRQMVVVGSRQMVQYEDTSSDASVRIYDRGMDFSEPPANFGEYRLTYRTGDMVAPQIEPAEPLGLELKDFASAIREGTTPARARASVSKWYSPSRRWSAHSNRAVNRSPCPRSIGFCGVTRPTAMARRQRQWRVG